MKKNISNNLLYLLYSTYHAGSRIIPHLKSYLSHRSIYLYLSCLLFAISSCDYSFEPLEENDQYLFSIYGFLDVDADTQWIRITPVREQVDMLAEGRDIRVTLTNVETGREIIMNDSLFQLDRNFLNFWTDEPIEYDQTYRLTAELGNRGKSEVTVITPEEMPLPKIVLFTTPGPVPPEIFVFVDSQVNLADIQTKYYIRIVTPNLSIPRTISFPYRNVAKITEEFPNYYTVELHPEDEIEEIERQVLLPPNGEIEMVYRQVYVATSGIEWNEEIETLDDVTYALPQTLQNVENGLGYVLGIDSKYIPYAGCRDVDGNFVSCGAEQPFW